jgi:hypothetical protein
LCTERKQGAAIKKRLTWERKIILQTFSKLKNYVNSKGATAVDDQLDVSGVDGDACVERIGRNHQCLLYAR